MADCDSLFLKLTENPLKIEVLNDNMPADNGILVQVITFSCTLLGIFIGFFLNQYSERKKEYRKKLDKFKMSLISYSNGSENYREMLYGYSVLNSKDKKKYEQIIGIDKIMPNEKEKILLNLIQK